MLGGRAVFQPSARVHVTSRKVENPLPWVMRIRQDVPVDVVDADAHQLGDSDTGGQHGIDVTAGRSGSVGSPEVTRRGGPVVASAVCQALPVRISHKVDYGVRALVYLAQAEAAAPGVPVKGDVLAAAESIPPKFLNDILRRLRSGGLLRSQRGGDGGWALARDPGDVTVADVIRVLEGPLASVRGIRPHDLADEGVPEPFVSLWVAVRVSLRSVLEGVTVADLAQGKLPDQVAALLDTPGAWGTR